MHPEQKSYLEQFGATFADGEVVDFGDAAGERFATRDGNIISDLSHQGKLLVTGADAAQLLQGQLTNDISALQPTRTQLSTYCTHKGRVVGLFRGWLLSEGYLLTTHPSVVGDIQQRLRKYVLRSDVTLTNRGDRYVMLGLSGPDAAKQLETMLGSAPEKSDQALSKGDLHATRLPGPHPRFLILGAWNNLQSLWQGLVDAGFKAVGSANWRWLDIQAALPSIAMETQELFTPQQLNVELLGGISFEKGCYTGQEVVARTQFLGAIKRRLYRAHVAGDTPLQLGTPLYAEGHDSGQGAGRVVMSAPEPEGGQAALVVIPVALRQAGEAQVETADGPTITLMDPPYPIVHIQPGKK